MKKSTVIKFVIALIVVMIIFWITLNYLKNKNNQEEVIEYNYFILFQDEKMGVIDRKGNILIEPKFDNIVIPNPGIDVFACSNKNESIKYLNKNAQELFSSFEEVTIIDITGIVLEVPYESKVLKFKKNGKYGLIDYSGNIIKEAIYEEIMGLSYKPQELKIKIENKYGVITVEGKERIKPEYDYIEGDKYYNEDINKSGYIVGIKEDNGYRYGYLDENLKKVLEVKYNNIERVLDIKSDDIYLIAYDNGKGAIIKNKKEITNYDYAKIEKVESEDLFWIEKNGKYGLLNMDGKSLLYHEYEEVYVEGVNIFTKKDGEDFIFDIKGNPLEAVDYFRKYNTQNKNYYITINGEGLYGIVDKNNNKLIDNQYVYLEYAFEDFFIVSNKEGKTGVIDKDNNTVIDIKYDIVEKLENGNIIQAVELENNRLELYDNKLEKVFDGQNIQIGVNKNYIVLTNGEETSYFNLNGNAINNIDEVTENSMPEKIGEFSKVYYSYGQVYYADLQAANE